MLIFDRVDIGRIDQYFWGFEISFILPQRARRTQRDFTEVYLIEIDPSTWVKSRKMEVFLDMVDFGWMFQDNG